MTISEIPHKIQSTQKIEKLGNAVNYSAISMTQAQIHVVESPANKRSVSRYSIQKTAQTILNQHHVLSSRTGKPHSARRCMHHVAYNNSIAITLNTDAKASRAGVTGLQTCNSIVACPVCAQRIMQEKRDDILRAIQWSERENLVPVMMTLTARHHAGMRLAQFRADFQRAWSMFNGSRKWKTLKAILGVQHGIYSREVTHGAHGWHYHMHILVFVPKSCVKQTNKKTEIVREAQAYWTHCLRSKDLDGIEDVALKFTATPENKVYLAKFGFSEAKDGQLEYELTGNANKGRSQFDLLTLAKFGDVDARMLYVEYVEAMSNQQIITFSNGFRELFEQEEIDAYEIPENQVLHRWLPVDQRTWTAIVRLGMVANVIRHAAMHRDKEKVRCWLQSLHDHYWYHPDTGDEIPF